jgi:uncharacterized protein YgiB involved in biofilm formation
MPQRKRRRSAVVTLALAGTLSGCGETEPQRDVYASLADCQRDWHGPAQCEPVRDGHYSGGSYYYGPHHYGSSMSSGRPRPSQNAFEAVRSPGGTSVARGGFGSSARSFSSGS